MTFAIAMSLCILTAGWGRVVMKKALEHKPPLICALIFEIVQVLVALPFFSYYQTPTDISYSIFSGFLFSLSLWFYFLSFHTGEVSLLTPLRGLRGVFALIISFLFLKEALHFFEILGILIIGIGIFLLKSRGRFETFVQFLFHREAILMTFSVILGVFSSYLDQKGTAANGYFSYYLFTCLSAAFFLFFASLLQYGKKTFEFVTSKISHHNLSVGVIFAISFLMQLIALQYERVTIVNGLLPLGIFVTTFLAGKFLQERVFEKIPGTILVILGTMLIAL